MPLNIRLLISEHIKYRFNAIQEHYKFVFKAYDSKIEEIELKAKGADEEYTEFLAEEIASIKEMKYDTTPLILLSLYAIIEHYAYNLAARLPGPSIDKRTGKMKCIKCRLSSCNINWDELKESDNVETLRLIVNSYKHNNGKIDSKSLADRLGQNEDIYINWKAIDADKFVNSGELFIFEMVEKVFGLTTG